MANDCLVKKLNGAADNDNLHKIGELVFEMAENSNPSYTGNENTDTQWLYLRTTVSNESSATAVTGGFKTSNSGGATDLASPVAIPNGGVSFCATPGTKISINNKYNIRLFQGPKVGPGIKININELSCSPLQRLIATGSGVTGNLSSLSNQSVLGNVILSYSKVTGTLSQLPARMGQLIIHHTDIQGNIQDAPFNLVEIEVSSTKVNGAVESFVEKYYNDSSRTISSCSLAPCGLMTLNNVSLTEGVRLTIAFNSSIATVSRNGSVVATYNGTTWVYA